MYKYNNSIMVRATKTSVPDKTVAKAPVKKTSKKEEAPTTPVPVVEPVEVVNEAVSSLDKNTLSGALLEEIASFNKNYASWMTAASAMKNNIKNIAKISARVSKNAEKTSKRKKNTQNGKLSGFEKPTLITDELAGFFGRPKGSRMARTEVSKEIHKYVTENNLQDENNRRIIHPDTKLLKLLNSKDDQLTYFNLQKYLKHHFKKEVAPVV